MIEALKAIGSRAQGGGHGARSCGVEGHDLRLESEVPRDGGEPGARSWNSGQLTF